MRVKDGKQLTLLCGEMYELWTEHRDGLSLGEMRIITKIFHYYDNDIECGHKELVADLNISSSALSKMLKNWLSEGSISTKKSSKDKRRNFYFPSKDLLELRDVNYKKIKLKFNQEQI